METIEFKGIEYPIRGIVINVEGEDQEITVGNTTLNNLLEADNFEGEAEHVDNQIYFYVSDEELEKLNDVELVALVESEA